MAYTAVPSRVFWAPIHAGRTESVVYIKYILAHMKTTYKNTLEIPGKISFLTIAFAKQAASSSDTFETH